MATSEPQIQDAIGKAIIVFQQLFDNANTGAGNYIQRLDDLTQTSREPWAGALNSAIASQRAAYSGMISRTTFRAWIDGLFQEYARILGFTESNQSIEDILDELARDFNDSAKSVQERAITYGPPLPGGGNVGDGTVYRLTTDQYTNAIEIVTPDAKEFRCIADEFSGANEHQERFQLRGSALAFDNLTLEGSGRNSEATALSAQDASTFLLNPTFTDIDGTVPSPLNSIPGWDIKAGSIATFALIEEAGGGETYRGGDGATLQRSLQFNADATIEQPLSTRNATLNPDVPMFLHVAYRRDYGGAAADGTLSITIGNSTTNVVLAAQAGWNLLVLPMDQKLWHRNYNSTDLAVDISLSGGSSFGLLIDDVVLAQMTQFDGSWIAIVGGPTKFLTDDEFTFADTVPVEAVIQYWLWKEYGKQLPPSAAPTWNDPV